ncbi:Cytoplasmic thioredoxin isoenzyme 2 [Dionaea muscipula]
MGSILSALFGGVGGAADGDDSSAELSAVIAFHSSDRWQLHYNSVRATNQLLVVDFSASWCAPCKLIEPAFNAMATQFPDVSFAKIDVDELPDVAQEMNVQAMPTFVLMKQGKEVDRVVGAKKDELERKIVKHR